MWARIDRAGRTCASWPLALLGIALSFLSQGCIRAAAWIADIDITEFPEK